MPGPTRRNPANPARSGRKQRQRVITGAVGRPVLFNAVVGCWLLVVGCWLTTGWPGLSPPNNLRRPWRVGGKKSGAKALFFGWLFFAGLKPCAPSEGQRRVVRGRKGQDFVVGWSPSGSFDCALLPPSEQFRRGSRFRAPVRMTAVLLPALVLGARVGENDSGPSWPRRDSEVMD